MKGKADIFKGVNDEEMVSAWRKWCGFAKAWTEHVNDLAAMVLTSSKDQFNWPSTPNNEDVYSVLGEHAGLSSFDNTGTLYELIVDLFGEDSLFDQLMLYTKEHGSPLPSMKSIDWGNTLCTVGDTPQEAETLYFDETDHNAYVPPGSDFTRQEVWYIEQNRKQCGEFMLMVALELYRRGIRI
ncbi:hypothetical protein [Delftia phage PhiW-14]|uniref:Uncharacterized protein n=1 Tax=Delftia phage PhiW-14 TaxID=665032 RepID=C9DGG5_BPW14|nr:hypothetical protein DP-phiW-14_gp195 [Delftia phage PhiW-14]ACV50216.1 hypothetical protein [Delftia phage PhiW-14]